MEERGEKAFNLTNVSGCRESEWRLTTWRVFQKQVSLLLPLVASSCQDIEKEGRGAVILLDLQAGVLKKQGAGRLDSEELRLS